MDLYFDMTMVHDGDFNHVDDHDDNEVDDDGEPLPFATNWLQGNTFPIPSFFKPFVVDERSIYLNLFIFSFGKSDLSDTHYSTVNRRPCIYFLHLWFLESLN